MDSTGGTCWLRGAAGVRVRALAVVGALAFATACSPVYRNHGFIPSDTQLQALTPGVDTRETVQEALGSPTAGSVLDENGFYWVASRFRIFGMLAPREVDRDVVALDFDSGGILRNIEHYGLEDGRVLALTREVTDDNLRDTTFLRQLLSGLGRFDASTILGSD